MGTGSIGSDIARVAKPFGMRITGFSRSGASAEGFERVFAGNQLDDFLAEPDYLVCVLPDTPGTRHLLDAGAFRAMKKHCYLVNVGRGALIDEQALAEALFKGELSGAVLDVFQTSLCQMKAIVECAWSDRNGTCGATSWPEDIARIFSENYRRYVEGEPLKYQDRF